MRNEVPHRVKERNILNTVKRRKDNWTGHMLRSIVHTVKSRKDNWTGHMLRNIVHTVKRRKDNWTGHTLRRNCLLQYFVGRNLEGRTGDKDEERGRKQLLDDPDETMGHWELKEEALDSTLWRTGCGRVCGPAVRQTTEGIREYCTKWKSASCPGHFM